MIAWPQRQPQRDAGARGCVRALGPAPALPALRLRRLARRRDALPRRPDAERGAAAGSHAAPRLPAEPQERRAVVRRRGDRRVLDREPPDRRARSDAAARPRRVPVRRGSPVLQARRLRPARHRARRGRTSARDGDIKQGGSTITQQIIKQTLLAGEEQIGALDMTPEGYAKERKAQKYRRKMKELILAVRLERELTKAEILSIYLNHVYLGHGAYGVGAAAETYFGKEVEDLTIAEAAMLAGLVASPTKYAPHRNMQLARERQRYVLGHMREDNYISDAEYQAALAEPIALVDESDLNHLASPYFVEHVRAARDEALRQPRSVQGRAQVLLDARHAHAGRRRGRAAQRARVARSQARLPRPDRQRSRRPSAARGPAGPRIRSPARPTTPPRSPISCSPIRRYGAMVVELPRTGVGVIVDLGPKRLPLVEADAKDVRAWRGTTRPARPSKLGDLLPIRLSARRRTRVHARPAPRAPGRDDRDGAVHRPRARDGRRLRLDGQPVRSRDPGQAPGRLVDQAVHLLGRARGRQDAGRAHARRPVLGARPRPACGRPRTTTTSTSATSR